MSFINDIITNSIEAQSIFVQDMLKVPAIKINGAVFNGEISGGVTLPYLESNYPKKSDVSGLDGITSTNTSTILTKTLNVPSIEAGNVTASNVYTNMNNVTDSATVNVGYANNLFPQKSSVYTRLAADGLLANKVDNTSFNAYQNQVVQSIASKADAGVSYTKSQSDSLVSGKLDSSIFGTYQGSVASQLANKLNVGDTYTTNQVDNIAGGKLDKTYQVSNDQAVSSKVSQFSFDTFVASNNLTFAGKANVSDVYTKADTNNLLNGKVANDYFQTYATAQSNALNTKLPQTSFDAFQTSNQTALNTKVDNTTFGNFQATNTTALTTKYNVSDFNSFNASNNTALGNKLNTSEFNTYKSTNDTAVSLKVSQSDYDTNKSSTNASIATKQTANSYLSGINQGLSTTDSPSFSAVTVSGIPSTATSLTNKAYVDSVGTSSVVAGSGLSKTGSTLSINSAQPDNTLVGTLTSLNVSGNIKGNNLISANSIFGGANGFSISPENGTLGITIFGAGTVALTNTLDATATNNASTTIYGGLGVAKSVYIGSTLNVTGVTSLGNLSILGNGTCNGTFNVVATSTFGHVNIGGTITATGDVNIGGALNITGLTYTTGLIANCLTNNGGLTPNPPQEALVLLRGGVNSQSYGNKVSFQVSRYTNDGTNARTQLSVLVTKSTAEALDSTPLTIRSDGLVSMPGSLSVSGTVTTNNLTASGTLTAPTVNVSGLSTLSTLNVTGTLTAGSFAIPGMEIGTIASNVVSQNGVTFVKTLDTNTWSRLNKTVHCTVRLAWNSSSGLPTGQTTFVLPFNCLYVNQKWLYAQINGNQVLVLLILTAGLPQARFYITSDGTQNGTTINHTPSTGAGSINIDFTYTCT